ncbi:MAG: hypothetical protein Q4C14_08085 [Bacillota bacterium]|nr:hypothetical protein [Bacillota bacterium]
MNSIRIRSRMNEEDFKNYLFYHQYFEEKHYIPVRIGISFGIGLAAAFLSADRLVTFLVLSVLCLLVFIVFPWCRIRYSYKKIYIRNRSAAFSQSQDFEFTRDYIGFKSEREDEYMYEPYSNIKKAAETDTLYIITFSKKETAVAVKRFADSENQNEISRLLEKNLGDRYTRITRI